jgi:hypothetical protein
MTRRTSGFLMGALAMTLFASSASAAFTLCQTVGSITGTVPFTPQPATLTCPSIVVPAGSTLTSVDLQLVNDAQGPASIGSTVQWTWNNFSGVPEAGTQVNSETSSDGATFNACVATAIRINATCPTLLNYPLNIAAGNTFNAVSVQVAAAATVGGVSPGGGDSARLLIQYNFTAVPPPITPPCFDAPYQVRYAGNLQNGESFVDITNTGANGASKFGPGFGAVGNICANVYAFDPGEELLACCSCLITPNQTVSLRVKGDILAKPTHSFTGSEIVLKLVATIAGTGGTATNCTNSAFLVTQQNLVCGMAAWGTSLHVMPFNQHGPIEISGPAPPPNFLLETPFTPSTLSASELASMTNRCMSIVGNGSGFGVCPITACAANSGALGGAAM